MLFSRSDKTTTTTLSPNSHSRPGCKIRAFPAVPHWLRPRPRRVWASRAERGRTNVPQARRPSPTGAAGGRRLWSQSQQRLLDVFSKLLSTAALSPLRESPLRLICSAGSQGYEGAPSDTRERAPRGMDLRSGYQDIGGTWRPKAAGTSKQGRIPPEKREVS